ncbi:unnamed protein product [Diabrotica balteata]|uniref:Cytohesin Ubiquitin Protein Inducing domain-containing protein n=1 Tax=Diabrotica balteata TaxID=107213 RepID=A0A9P0DY05_DIABA|nr:unnamed protein product [Diabrotica balteata]
MLEGHNNVKGEENQLSNMGATRNMPSSRIIVLQERKKQLEEALAKRNQELKQLCIQEAELTGVTPPEMPLEPGENFPQIRRRIGTSFQLPETLVKNASDKDEMIAALELEIQLHANMAEAALGLANEHNMSKTMKRQHRSEYQKHKQKGLELQEKLAALKEKAAVEQQKQKKKLRAPDNVSNADDTISLNTNGSDPFLKTDPRHSMSSAKHSITGDSAVELRYRQEPSRQYRITELPYLANQANKPDDVLNGGFYRLSLNGYNKYMERRENINNVYPAGYITGPQQFQYNSQMSLNQHMQHSFPYQQNSPISPHNPLLSQHSPHLSQHSPHFVHISQHKPQHSPQKLSQYPPYSSEFTDLAHRQSSPTTSLSPKSHYYPSHPTLTRQNYRQYESDVLYRNPHQIQPHQQYEQMNVMAAGLGGYWKKTQTGELIWYSSSVVDGTWQRDKRFGSLDRRKTKRVSSRISPNMENKSATLSTVSNYQGQVRSASVKNSQILSRRSQDNGQLVRTQSLGSVGAITIDSVYPTDDSSSYGSDCRNMDPNQISKKHKEKEWLETSLDGPISPQGPPSPASPISPSQPPPAVTSSHSQPPMPVFLTEDKVPKEIPAESNPSPKVRETNIELFNNNIPKNCTIVQAGHCKPYHEETKPFEMSDFYKYSTKFKKSPIKSDVEGNKPKLSVSGTSQTCLSDKFEELPKNMSTSNYQNINNSGTPTTLHNFLNTSLELDRLAVSEHFSDEMNAWYREQRTTNNNSDNSTTKSRSTATLV